MLAIVMYLFFLIHYLLLILFFPILWIKYRWLPYKKKRIEIELMIVHIDLSLAVQGFFEGLLGTKKIHRRGREEKKLPLVFYISKKDFSKFAEHVKFNSKKTVLVTLELSYWKYGFGKSRLVTYKTLDKTPEIRK